METYEIFGNKLTLPAGRAKEIENTFKPFDFKLNAYDVTFKEIIAMEISPETCEKAKELRKKLTKIRTGSEKARKEIKADVLQLSKAIDSVGKYIKDSVSDKEEKLKEIETHYERLEAEKKEKLKTERLAELAKYEVDGSSFNVENMDKNIWTVFLAGQKANYEEEKERKKQELINRMKEEKLKEIDKKRRTELSPLWSFLPLTEEQKQDSFADLDESEYSNLIKSAEKNKEEFDKKQEEIRKENERLREEQKEKDRQLKAERDAKERELKAEREKKEKLERELREKKEAERKENERKKAEELAKRQAPDKEKLLTWLESFDLNVPEFTDYKFTLIAESFKEHLLANINNAKSKL